MKWYYAAILAGIFMPLVLFGRNILVAFREGGLGTGISYWLGIAVGTIPLAVFFFWIGKSLGGG